jgi:Secretion system C-terminal sorting domain
MKKSLTMLIALFCALSLSAQSPMCMRDSIIFGTDSLLWPLPYTPAAPYYNLNEFCIDHPYNQSMTINVPSTFETSFGTIPLTSISIATQGAIANLPIGITYDCDPPNCVFRANMLGCIILYGTPTGANMAPDTLEFYIDALMDVGIPLPISLPSSIMPDSYYYMILKTPECLVGNFDLGSQFTLLKNSPNPFGSQTLITVESLVSGDFQFEVFDLLGQRLYMQKLRIETGRNELTFDAGELANGVYFYTISNRDGKAVRRMIVAR